MTKSDDSGVKAPPKPAIVKPEKNPAHQRSIKKQKEHGQFPRHNETIGGG